VKRLHNPLTYARADMPGGQKLLLHLVERSHGIKRASGRYHAWRSGFDLYQGDAMNRLLAACDIKLDVRGEAWPPPCLPGRPLLMIANHPFGVPDGVAALALAEQIGRPVKILIHSDLLRIPEIEPFALPIDFSETREALQINAASGREAIARLKNGETIIIFPAGGIATADWPLGRAGDLPWKTFVAKLVHKARADVVPLYFSGQNSWIFHAASRVSMFLRTSLIMPEALRCIGRTIEVRVGATIAYEQMSGITDRTELTALLRRSVFALCPHEVSADRVGRIRAMSTGRTTAGKHRPTVSSAAPHNHVA
jgi:putative hemolysin